MITIRPGSPAALLVASIIADPSRLPSRRRAAGRTETRLDDGASLPAPGCHVATARYSASRACRSRGQRLSNVRSMLEHGEAAESPAAFAGRTTKEHGNQAVNWARIFCLLTICR